VVENSIGIEPEVRQL